MGNNWVSGVDPDGGWKTKWGRFWAWVGNGFRGKFVGDGNASDPNHNYGLLFSDITPMINIDGGFQSEITLTTVYSGSGLAKFNHGFEQPVLPPATFLELFTGRTIEVGNQLKLTYNVDKYGYLAGIKPIGGLGFAELVGPYGPIRISKVAADWAVKGAHVHVKGVELAIKPGINGSVVIKSVYSSTSASRVKDATKILQKALHNNSKFKAELIDKTIKARDMLKTGDQIQRSASGELNFLLKALNK